MDEQQIRKIAREEAAQMLADFALRLKTEAGKRPVTADDVDFALGPMVTEALPNGPIR